jgi:protein TonB
MSYKPLTYFTALSVAAHAAMLGLWSEPESTSLLQQESTIEIGLVVLPQIDKEFSTEKNSSQAHAENRPQETNHTPLESTANPPKQIEHKSVIADNIKQVITPAEPEGVNLHVAGASQPITTRTSSAQTGSNPTSAAEAAPLYAKNPAPTYPNDALRYGWEGEVWLIVNVSRIGAVNDVSIDRSSGYPTLDRAAANTVRKWQFEPARVGSEAVEGTVRIPVRFKINRG